MPFDILALHAGYPPRNRPGVILPVGEGFARFSCGAEATEDLVADIAQVPEAI